jgi:large subunit ribosomal protein L15
MIAQNELKPPLPRRKRKRIGRGLGSGHGRYSGRGAKGQKSRSGGGVAPYFEGGQTPLTKRLPQKRGFKNMFRGVYQVVNVGSLNCFEGEVNPQLLFTAGLISDLKKKVKILAEGELEKKLTVKVHEFSAKACAKIESPGGEVIRLDAKKTDRTT